MLAGPGRTVGRSPGRDDAVPRGGIGRNSERLGRGRRSHRVTLQARGWREGFGPVLPGHRRYIRPPRGASFSTPPSCTCTSGTCCDIERVGICFLRLRDQGQVTRQVLDPDGCAVGWQRNAKHSLVVLVRNDEAAFGIKSHDDPRALGLRYLGI